MGMTSTSDRQEPANRPAWTEQERVRLAAMIGPQRKSLGLKQSDLADRAGVSVRTIGNIERGETVPQADRLVRLLVALGLYDDAANNFTIETRAWLTQVGQLIELIPEGPRAHVMVETVVQLGKGVQFYAAGNVVPFPSLRDSDPSMSEASETIPDEDDAPLLDVADDRDPRKGQAQHADDA